MEKIRPHKMVYLVDVTEQGVYNNNDNNDIININYISLINFSYFVGPLNVGYGGRGGGRGVGVAVGQVYQGSALNLLL